MFVAIKRWLTWFEMGYISEEGLSELLEVNYTHNQV